MQQSQVSVLMPVYNGAKYLRESVGSVMQQTFGQWELIVLDDGSTDGSAQILRELARTDSRIRYIYKENDPTGNVARNLRLMCAEARGRYAFYMSQDDTVAPDCLEQLVSRAEVTGADIVLPDMLLRYADGTTGEWPCSYPPGGDHAQLLTPHEAFYLSVDFTIHGFGLVRMPLMTDSRQDTRYFDSDEYNSRMQFLWANRIAFAPTTFYYFRGNPDAITRRFAPRRFQSLYTAVMLSDSFSRVFSDRDRRLRLMTWLLHRYITMAHLYFTHCDELNADGSAEVDRAFTAFEHKIHFKGYRWKLFARLNHYERVFALAYFLFGSARPLRGIYRLLHKN